MKTLKSLGFLVLVFAVMLWVVNAYIEVVAKRMTITHLDDLPEIEAVVVPGASVYRSGKLSPVLEQRMNAAIRVLRLRPLTKLLVSGHAIKGGYSETLAMIDYAKRHGIDDTRILQDDGGRSTYVTMLHCRREFALSRILLVTQPFHLPRGLYVGNRLGLTVFGYPAAETSEENDLPLREYFVRFKDFILVRISRGFNAN
jgi:SanA protein